jgi:hypothetical protein
VNAASDDTWHDVPVDELAGVVAMTAVRLLGVFEFAWWLRKCLQQDLSHSCRASANVVQQPAGVQHWVHISRSDECAYAQTPAC